MNCWLNTTVFGRRLFWGLILLLTAAGAQAQTSGGAATSAIWSAVNSSAGSLQIPGAGSYGMFTSLEATGSYGLFLNTNDYAYNNEADLARLTGDESTRYFRTPSATGEGEPHVIFTNLSNIAYQDSSSPFSSDVSVLQLGTVKQLGPGNISAGLAYAVSEDELSGSTSNPGGADPNTNSASSEEDRVDLYVGYGFPIGDMSSLGFSLRYANIEDKSSDTDVFPLAFQTITDSSSEENSLLSFAAAFRMDLSDTMHFNVRGWYTDEDVEATATEVDRVDNPPTTETVAEEVEALELSGRNIGVIGRFNMTRGDSDFEGYLGHSRGKMDLDRAIISDTFTDMGTVVFSAVEEWADEVENIDFYIGFNALRRFGDLDVAGGVQLNSTNYEIDVRTMIMEPAATPLDENSGAWEQDVLQFALPISLRYHLSENFSIGAGARWLWQETETDLTEIFDVNGTDPFTSTTSTSTTSTGSDYRIYARYDARNASAQLLWGDTSSATSVVFDERDQIDLRYVAVQVNFSW